MDGSLTVTALLGRTSDRVAEGALGAAALAPALAARGQSLRCQAVGEPEAPREGHWREDLRAAAPMLSAAVPGGILLASDCSICIASLPRLDDDVTVVWLDAHADFNSPETTVSQFLGGMCLAGACGVWDTGWGAIDPRRVVLCGLRDVEAGEADLLRASGATVIERPGALAPSIAGRRIFVHLDLDVLDPGVLPGAAFPVPGGLSDGGLRTLLAEVVAAADALVGAEITSFTAPDLARRFATILEPLLPT